MADPELREALLLRGSTGSPNAVELRGPAGSGRCGRCELADAAGLEPAARRRTGLERARAPLGFQSSLQAID